MDEEEAEGSEASFFLVGAGEKASPPPSTATRIPETGGAEVFGSLGALRGLSGDLVAFRLAIVKQRGGAKTTEKLSAKRDDSGKRKRRDVLSISDNPTGLHRSSVEVVTRTLICALIKLIFTVHWSPCKPRDLNINVQLPIPSSLPVG